MKQFKLGHAVNPDWGAALDSVLEQTGTEENYTLGFLYLSDDFSPELENILDDLKHRTGIAHWVGSVGHAILCSNNEYYDQPALAVLLTDLAEDCFSIFNDDELPPKFDTTDPMAGINVALVHADPRNSQVPDIIEQLPDQIGNGYLCGGLTSSANHYYQIADEVSEGVVSGVVFNDQVPVVTGLSQGCSPIGPIHTLTECDQHMAISIDNKPAMDIFKQDIGEVLARDIDRAAGYIFVGFPVTDSDTGDYLVRNIVGIDPEHGRLAIGDIMSDGKPIMFCRRDGKTARDDMLRMLEGVKKRLNGATPRGGVYISCLGRGHNLFGRNSEEVKMISEVLGDIPLVGFYANGEISGHRLYGYTGVLTLFL